MESENGIETDECPNEEIKVQETSEKEDVNTIDVVNPDINNYDWNFMSASELLTMRENVHQNKGKDESLDFLKGPKRYAPSESLIESEIMEKILESQANSLKLEHTAKIRDLMKAEWDDELNVAVTPNLKGKMTQHMGQSMKGKFALAPEEALFLLEKSCIEVKFNNVPLSIEEAYSVMLKGDLAVEKYIVYSALSQQGFKVIRHQARISSKRDEVVPAKKRKASTSFEEPSEKRISFSGVLSCSEVAPNNNSDVSNISSECQYLSCSNTARNIDTPEPYLNNEQMDTTEKSSSITFQNANVNSSLAMPPSDELNTCNKESSDEIRLLDLIPDTCESNKEVQNSGISSTECLQEVADGKGEVVEKLVECEEIAVEEDNMKDCSEILIDDRTYGDKSDELNVDEVSNSSSDKSIQVDDDESSQVSIDVLSCSTVDSGNSKNAFSNESFGFSEVVNDDVTLLEVKKKETKPLAVIDLLSDDEPEEENQDITAESDDEIQVVKVCPALFSNHNKHQINTIKSEDMRERKPKLFSHQQMSFPDLFKKEILCLPCPPAHLLPINVQPAKEAYVITRKKSSQPKQPKLWNSFRDLQQYQYEKRQNKHLNGHNSQHLDSPRDQNYLNSNFHNFCQSSVNDYYQGLPTDSFVDMNDQNFNARPPFPTNSHADQNRHPLPTNSFIPQSPMPFLNIPNMMPLSMFPSALANEIQNEIQRTLFSVTSRISSVLGQHLNSRNLPASDSPFPMSTGYPNHSPHNFNPIGNSEVNSDQLVNSTIKSDIPVMFPPEQHWVPDSTTPFPMNDSESNHSSFSSFRQRDTQQKKHSGPLFPCPYRRAPKKSSWSDIKSTVRGADESDSGSDIAEIPIDPNEVLWSNHAQPVAKLRKPEFPIPEFLKPLQVIDSAELVGAKGKNERCLPNDPKLEISYDVYLPGCKFKKTALGIPKYRIVVLRNCDPIPRYSEIVFLQRKWNDGSQVQLAVVNGGDISFYSFNDITFQEVTPHFDSTIVDVLELDL